MYKYHFVEVSLYLKKNLQQMNLSTMAYSFERLQPNWKKCEKIPLSDVCDLKYSCVLRTKPLANVLVQCRV